MLRYSELANLYEQLERISSKHEKTAIIASFLRKVDAEDLDKVALLLLGKVFPPWSMEELGFGTQLMIRAIAIATGANEKQIENAYKETGDLGLAAERFVARKKQMTLFQQPLTVDKVIGNLRKVAKIEGEGSIDKKIALVAELLTSASPKEAKYIVRTVLEELRIGVAEGIIRDAISLAFNVPVDIVERAYNLTNDLGFVAKIAKEKGKEGLQSLKLEPGRPIKVMLAQKVESVKEALEKMGGKVAVEIKYDGARMQIHKKGDKITLFTRRLENVTRQFPDIVDMVKKGIKAEECIVEGEAVAIDENGKPRPFQTLSRRIKRKYDIEKMVKEIPVELNLFDIVYLNGKSLIDVPFEERRKILESIVELHGKLKLAEQLISDNVQEIEKFYKKALDMGHEGIMIKNLKAPYKPGSRVGYMVKLKPTMETLDLVIIGAEWGEGKRAHWLSSYLLACRDPDTGKYLSIGKMGTGLTEDQFREMTERLKPLIIRSEGKFVEIKPSVVVEVAYEEIQKSPNYESGFALRFPRLVRVREDRGPEDIDTIYRVRKLYEEQFGKKE